MLMAVAVEHGAQAGAGD